VDLVSLYHQVHCAFSAFGALDCFGEYKWIHWLASSTSLIVSKRS
jgi:hypothetical protein